MPVKTGHDLLTFMFEPIYRTSKRVIGGSYLHTKNGNCLVFVELSGPFSFNGKDEPSIKCNVCRLLHIFDCQSNLEQCIFELSPDDP